LSPAFKQNNPSVYPFQDLDYSQAKLKRVASIDILKGIALILLTFNTSLVFLYKVPETFKFSGFISFWITSLCFPVFAFLVGIAIYYQQYSMPRKWVLFYCLIVGPLYILFDALLVSFGYTFSTSFNHFSLQILSAIGVGLIILPFFIYLKPRLTLMVGLLIFFCNNVLFYFAPKNPNLAWSSVVLGGQYSDGNLAFIFYPFLQIVGVMLLGFYIGRMYSPSFATEKRKYIFKYIGIGLLTLFVILKIVNSYGDIVSWAQQDSVNKTIASFLSVTSSPPTLMYLSLVLGLSLLILSILDTIENRITKFFKIIGRNAALFTLLQLFFIHIICAIVFYLKGGIVNYPTYQNLPLLYRIPTDGFGIVATYIFSIIVISLVYIICLKYDKYKIAKGN